ncbi:MAG: hypothetical protein L3J28_13880 [Candidatus Polarisedimenticolaceae bacterium]|nr:hypothetical protein [Candidatus Polarisedimenticolaceae bacterium]
MEIQNTTIIVIAILIFLLGLLALFALRRSNQRSLRVENGNGVFIAGDGNRNISAQVSQTQPETEVTPLWKKIASVIAWLAALAGPIIAALAYWLPRAGA